MGKIAFLFSGQGSQYTGMGKSLYETSEAAKNIFNIAESQRMGTTSQCFEASIEELSITKNTQPCLFCVDLAAACALKESGINPHSIAGFSLGEIAAIAFSGMLNTAEAFGLVTKRAELMQAAAEKTNGAMAAVLKLSNEQVEALCEKFENVFPVNYNCPGQLVVAGKKDELGEFVKAVAELKGKAIILKVSGGFHSPFMQEAADGIETELKKYSLKEPQMPVYSNFTALPYAENKAELITKQVSNPVKWQETIENMIANGVDTFIEVGAGKTLSGLIKKINKDVAVFNVEDAETLRNALAILKK